MPVQTLLSRLRQDERGASAIEFAVIAPFMLLLLIGSFDITRAIDAKNKVSQLSRTISDFVSQSQQITPTELGNIVKASKSVLYPYPDSSDLLTIRIDSIRTINDAFVSAWHYDTSQSPCDSDESEPTTFVPPDPSVILTTVTYRHHFTFAGFMLERLGMDTISMSSSTYMSPRWGTPVEASNFNGTSCPAD